MDDLSLDLARELSGRYAIEQELGRGGMATVWLARDLRYDRRVALKVLRPEVAISLGSERFLREIKLAARLQHPHVVSVYDSGEIVGGAGRGTPILWFTMPYVEGESLRERVRREGSLPPEEAVRIAREVARGLHYAHQQGVVHRDVKPENILLTRDGSTLVADFGIARPSGADPSSHLTQTGVVVGTPAYMSPEQAGGADDLDPRTDIYSLGCVLYEMLTGEPPFGGASAQAIVAKHMTAQPALGSGPGARIPDSVRPALARALAKSRSERQATAEEFAAALGGAEERAAPARRLAAVGGLVAAAVAAFLFMRAVPDSDSAMGAGAASTDGGSVASALDRKLGQLTFGAGVEEWPAWSPDGDRLAYVAEVDGHRHLFLRSLSGGDDRRLTQGPRDHIQPAWHPDGSRIAFVRATTPTGKLEPSDLDGEYFEGGQIWVTELEDGQETKLLDNGFNPSYSSDGARLAFDALLAGTQRIWVADIRGRNKRQVTSDSSEAVVHAQPRWSPDGGRLAFRRIEKTKSDIAVVDPATQRITRLTDDYVLDVDPAWSADGRSIFFTSSRGGGLNLWRIPVGPDGAAAGPVKQLTTGAGEDVQASPAPDGRRLAFAVRGIYSDLWRLPVAPESGLPTGEPEPVLATTRVESRGAWSPDGHRIAFNSDRLGDMNLWIRDLEAATERQVTSGPGGDYQPTWAPDGSALAFFSARGGNTDIWRVNLLDNSLTRLTDDPALDTNPFYSPDGRHIAFVSDRSGRSELWLMRADGSGQRQLASVGCWGHFLAWSIDGASVVFRGEREGQAQVYRVSIEDGALTPMPAVESGGHMSFGPSRELIMDVRSHKVIWVHPVDGRPAYRIYQFSDPDIRIDYPVWSPDGRWVLFDRAAPKGGDLWVLEGF